ncbi:MAG: hypothetical protein ABW000_07260 [Actinoplanes sp.]
MDWAEFVAGFIPTPHAVSLEALTGSGGYGDVYAAAAPFGPCVVEETSRVVTVQTVDAEGTERLSSTTVYGPLSPTVTPGSRITLPWSTDPATVLAVSRMDAHGHDLPAHQELALE